MVQKLSKTMNKIKYNNPKKKKKKDMFVKISNNKKREKNLTKWI